MKLYATPLSHFSRKVRLIFDFYSLPYESIDVGNVAEGGMEKFANNPLSQVPVLLDGENWLVDSDHIARYLVDKIGRGDALGVRSTDVLEGNVRALLNGIMAEEVKVILAKRMLVPIENYPYFDKSFEAIQRGLEWLNLNAPHLTGEPPRFSDLHFICLWDHLAYYGLVPLAEYKNLEAKARELSKLPWVAKSAPAVLKPR